MVEPRFDADASTREARRALHEQNRLSWNEATKAPYGAIIWLSDLTTWARGIAAVLRPGGRFVAVEYHPVEMMFDEEFRHYMPYSTRGRPVTWGDGVSDYVAKFGPASTPSGWVDGVQGFQNPHLAHEFHWATSEIITALLDAGLALAHFREYDYCNGFRPYTKMKYLGGRRWTVPDGKPSLPFMYSVVARKPA